MNTFWVDQVCGGRNMKVYPVSDRELKALRSSAWLALTIVGIPFLIIEVLGFVRRLEQETKFETVSDTPTMEGDRHNG